MIARILTRLGCLLLGHSWLTRTVMRPRKTAWGSRYDHGFVTYCYRCQKEKPPC